MKKTFPKKGFIPYESNSFGVKNLTGHLGCNTRDFRTGFTLIELLVVISIIALISSLVLATLNQARAKARDASILSDIHTFANVMELYYSDFGYYPPANNLTNFFSATALTEIKGSNTEPSFISALSPYLKQFPNPNKYAVDQYKWANWGFGWGSGGISRISYNRPRYSKNVIYNQTGIMCDSLSDFNFSNNCYILTVRTETKTTLGPAETRIYIITGKNGKAKIIDTNNNYSWGLY